MNGTGRRTATVSDMTPFGFRSVMLPTIALPLLVALSAVSCMHRKHAPLAGILVAGAESFLFTRPGENDPQIRDRIVREIDAASVEVRLWCYELGEPQILDALIRANRRGIRLTITGSPDQDYDELKSARVAFHIRPRSGLQHSKAFLIDGQSFISGTGNFTTSDLFHNNNAFFFLRVSPQTGREIASALDAADGDAHPVDLPFRGRMLVGPSRGRLIQSILVRRVLEARQSVRYLIFSHTDPVLSSAILWSAQNGVLVEGIYDSDASGLPDEAQALHDALAGTTGFIYGDGNRAEFLDTDGNLHGGHLHHKTMILDDSIVLTGSFNYSMSARDSNQELFFEFRDPVAALLFREEFERVQKRSRIFARGAKNESIAVSDDSGILCASSIRRLTVFRGTGAAFGADHFRSGACVRPSDRSTESAGVSHGTKFPLAGSARLVHNLAWMGRLDGPTLPEAGSAAPIFRAANGTIWLSAPRAYTGAYVFSSSGLSQAAVSRLSPEVYSISPPVSGDFVLLLSGETGFEAGCIYTGQTVDGPVLDYVQAMEYEGKKVTCVAAE